MTVSCFSGRRGEFSYCELFLGQAVYGSAGSGEFFSKTSDMQLASGVGSV
jgi:hypothetical protein